MDIVTLRDNSFTPNQFGRRIARSAIRRVMPRQYIDLGEWTQPVGTVVMSESDTRRTKSRRPHNKSRTGCVNCKQRKVKVRLYFTSYCSVTLRVFIVAERMLLL